MHHSRIPAALALAAPLLAQLPQQPGPVRRPAAAAPTTVGSPASGGQALYIGMGTGEIYRVDNYATAPTATLVGQPGLGWVSDFAVDPVTGEFILLQLGGAFYRVDPVTMNATFMGFPGLFLNALDIDANGTIYGLGSGYLVEVDPVTGEATEIGSTGIGSSGDVGVDVSGALLWTTSSNTLTQVDPVTAQLKSLADLPFTFAYGLEVDLDGAVYVFTASGEVHLFDRVTGTTSLIGQIAGLPGSIGGAAFALTPPPGGGPVGTSTCGPAVANSSGLPGRIAAFGSKDRLLNYVRLDADQLPTNQFAMFINSMTQGFVQPPGSQGNLCLGGAIGRHNAFIQDTGTAGSASLLLDLAAVPTPTGTVSVQPGETWYWQTWFRDNNPGPTNNFTDGICITFQ